MLSRESPGHFRLDLEVGGIPVCLGTAIDSDEWRKAAESGVFSHVGIIGRLLLGAGLSAGDAFSARNQDIQLFGGKVLVAPDLSGGPLRFGTSASVFFRDGSLYRLQAGVSGNKKASAHFTRQCAHALTRLLGDPSQHPNPGTHIWWGSSDRLTLNHSSARAAIIHELVAGS